MNTVKEQQRNIANMLGISPDQVRTVDPQWAKYMKEGVVVTLSTGRWRATMKLDLADMGIRPEEKDAKAIEKLVRLGHRVLAPADWINAMDRAERRARRAISDNALQTHWGWFVPVTTFQKVQETLAEAEADLRRELSRMTDQGSYNDAVDEVLGDYRVFAANTFKRLERERPELVADTDLAEFVQRTVDRVRANIPTPAEIEGKFFFDVEYVFIPLPDILAEEQRRAELARMAQETAWMQEQAERSKVEEELATVRAKEQAERDIARAEARAAQTAADIKEQELRRMNRAVVETARRQAEGLVDGFMNDVQAKLNGLIYDAVSTVSAYMNDKGKMHPRNVVQLKNMIDKVQELNFVDDEDVDAMIERIKSELAVPADSRSFAEVSRVMNDIAIVTGAELAAIGSNARGNAGREVERWADIGLDFNTEQQRGARARLGLDDFEIDLGDLFTGREGVRGQIAQAQESE